MIVFLSIEARLSGCLLLCLTAQYITLPQRNKNKNCFAEILSFSYCNECNITNSVSQNRKTVEIIVGRFEITSEILNLVWWRVSLNTIIISYRRNLRLIKTKLTYQGNKGIPIKILSTATNDIKIYMEIKIYDIQYLFILKNVVESNCLRRRSIWYFKYW